MTHSVIVGTTRSGKTTLALNIAEESKARGWPIIVFDPMLDPRFSFADVHTSDKDEFLRAFFNSRSCRVFIDECVEVASNSDKDIITTATRGRHYGHQCFYISQRFTSIARNIRSQCSQVFAFKQHSSDADLIVKEYASPELKGCAMLPRGSYIYSDGFTIKHGKVF